MDGKLPKTRCWFGARSIVGGIRGWATSLEKVTLHVVQGWVKELLADCAASLPPIPAKSINSLLSSFFDTSLSAVDRPTKRRNV